MANQTITTSTDMETVIAGGLLNGENITTNAGAVITQTETASVLFGRQLVNDGELHVDGTAITANNIINLLGEGGDSAIDETITIGGQGTLRVTGAWFSIGTTDGTNSQVIDLSVATGCGYWLNNGVDFCPATIPMIQIETGRRINYTAGTGLAPAVNDMMTLVSDRTVMGKIVSVGAGFFVVNLLTGSFVGGEAIQIRKVVDNFGADLQQTWTGTVNGADVKEAGVYHMFGNSRSDQTSYIASFGHGYGGLVFDNAFAALTLTLGSSVGGGFAPPTGCNIRTPNVNLNSSRIAEYTSNLAYMPAANNDEANWYGIECSAGGTVTLDIVCASNFMLADANAYAYSASYVGAVSNIGSNGAATRTTFDYCVVVQDPVAVSEPLSKNLGAALDLVSGADITNCMVINSCILGMTIGATTSLDVDVSDCIVTSAGQTPILDTNAVHNFYFNNVKGTTLRRCMSFGNNHSGHDQALVYLRGSAHICSDFMFSATQDYSFQTQEIDTISFNGCSDSIISGIEVIGNGVGGDDMMTITDSLDVKVRAIGMIDDKVDFGSDGEYIVNVIGLCDGIDIARCWKDNGSVEEAVVIPTTAKNSLVTNCSGKYLSEIQPSGVDTVFSGIHGGAGTPGGTTGWEDAYNSSYGKSIHHGFQSDTRGTIACLMITPSPAVNETTVIAGNPKFFKDGDLDGELGDIIEFTPVASYYIIGLLGFTGNFTAATGTSSYFADEWPNVDLFFQYEINGGGWGGTWLDIRIPANWTSISAVAGDKFRPKFRLEFTGSQTSMSMLLIEFITTLTAQKDNLYPIDQVETPVKIVVTDETTGDIVTDARVHVVAAAGGTMTEGAVIINAQVVNGLGEASAVISNINQPYKGLVVDASAPSLHVPKPISGTIPDGGLTLNVSLVSDE